MSSQEELRRTIADQFILSLKDNGLPPWRRPWCISANSGFPTNALSGRKYSGINILLLKMAAMTHNFQSKYWATFHQWTHELGGKVMRRPENVKRGTWGQSIVFFTRVTKTEMDPSTGEEEETSFPILKTFCVFNVSQVVGPFDHLRVKEESLNVNPNFVDFQPGEDLVNAIGPDIRFGGDRACYHKIEDYIKMPHKHRFKDPKEYYATLFHEIIHSTESKCNWTGSYAEAELRAEIGAAFTLAALGIPQSDNLTNHKAYVASWLEALHKDSRFIFRAASAASKAADYILSFAPQHQPEPEPVEAF
jgi:antirestriction protein ArdC